MISAFLKLVLLNTEKRYAPVYMEAFLSIYFCIHERVCHFFWYVPAFFTPCDLIEFTCLVDKNDIIRFIVSVVMSLYIYWFLLLKLLGFDMN